MPPSLPRPLPSCWTVTLCADDYGLAPGVSAEILELLAAGRLSATGAMTVFPEWMAAAADLAPLRGRADLGLHVTLTDQVPLGPLPTLAPHGRLPRLRDLLRRSFLGRIDPAEVADELRRQLDAFEDGMGAPPDFVDGHQHVHLLPGVRQAVLAVLAERYPAGTVWLRDCAEPAGRVLARGIAVGKALFIAGLSRGLADTARATGIATNTSFRGVYDFGHGSFRKRFQRFLAHPVDGALIMLHPGRVDAVLASRDGVLQAREAERDYLASAALPEDMAAAGARLGRMGRAADGDNSAS